MGRILARSTRGVAVQISLVLAAAALAIGIIVYAIAHEAVEAQIDEVMKTERTALLSAPGPDRLSAVAAAVRRRAPITQPRHILVLLVDDHGRRIAGNSPAGGPGDTGYARFLRNNDGHMAQATIAGVDGGALIIAADRSDREKVDRALLVVLGGGFAAVVMLAIGAAWAVSTVTRKRLGAIDRTARAIIDGDFSRRIPRDESGSEFDRASATLNRMLDRIAALMENLRQVSSDVAHDLRTPLTRLRNRLEDAKAVTSDVAGRAGIEAAIGQADELLEIFAGLLRISEIEAMGVRRGFAQVDLSKLLTDLIDTYRTDAEASEHRLAAAIEPAVAIPGDERLLAQLTSNLLDNALHHTPPGTAVTVTLRASQDQAMLTVGDNGPGVAEADRTRIFQRFSRGEASRSTDGYGLGLALVHAIAEAHHGTARLLDGPGFAIEVTLAKA
jgi:hypothetical protein